MVLYKASHLGFILRFFGTATMPELESLINELDNAGFKYGKVFDFRNQTFVFHTFGNSYSIVYKHAEDEEVLYFEIEANKRAETTVEIESLDPTELAHKDVKAEKARFTAYGYDIYEVNRADFLRDYKLSRIFK